MLPTAAKTVQTANTYIKSTAEKLLYRTAFRQPSTIFAAGFNAKIFIDLSDGSLQNIGVSQKLMVNPIPTIFCISLNFAQISAKILPSEYTNTAAAAIHRGRSTVPRVSTPSTAQTVITRAKKIILEIRADSVRTVGKIPFLNCIFFTRYE